MTIELTGVQWFKSSRSGGDDECVEIAWLGGGHIGVRDSKNPAGPALRFAPEAWAAFAAGLRGGEFDGPLG